MAKGPKQGKNLEKKRMDNMEKAKSRSMFAQGGRDILRREAQFRIAPKHPGMGRR